MKLLYSVFFNAPMGGLHENVYSTALFMKRNNCDVYVVLKPGLLQERLNRQGIRTITTDFSDTQETLKNIEKCNVNFDLIHFHPGPSKNAVLEYAEKYQVPIIETFHGTWSDAIYRHIHRLNAIITVSGSIRDYLQNRINNNADRYKIQQNSYDDKFHVIPNGFDPDLFSNPSFYDGSKEVIDIALVTRFDRDKLFIIDIMLLAVNHIKKQNHVKVNINVIGEGTYLKEFKNICKSLLANTQHTIDFKGWLVDEDLKNVYLDNDIIIAPGRSAIEGMISGKPVIAVGSKKYLGIIDQENWQFGVYNNFGGTGKKILGYEPNSIENDLDFLLHNRIRIKTVGEFSYKIAKQFFNADKINQDLLNLYEILCLGEKIKKSSN